jgi:exonuclease SbcC
MAKGDPARAEITASEQAANAGQVIATFTANIDAHQKAIADYRIFLDTKREPDHEPICRMCGRAISLEDRDHTRRHAQERIVETEREIDRLNASIVTQRARKEALDLEITESRTRASTLTTLQERVNNGRTKIAETVDQVRHIKASITKQHEELGRSEPVSEQEQSALEQQLTHERDQDKRHAALVPIRASLAAALERIELLSAQLTELGEVAFDPVALETARSALSEAQNAQTRIDSIDEQLMLRAQHKATISFQTPRLDELTVEIGRLSELLAANPIDDLALEKADMELERARQQEQTARGRAEQHRSTRLTIEHAMKQIEFEEKRIEDVARRADDARRDADDLDQMYKEFNAFEQYVSRRVRPQLEDMTSELVRVITENKYESVQYDDNYGIRVWDGITGAYPIEEFSGGERDVISLSARLALSRLIGSQAANPPSFLVLDEVFGSLDRDRRSNVLELLSSLAGSAESFRQLFVISHIDDVRLSPAFNEVWRVAETADGTSRLENLNLTQGSEDL